MNARIAALAVVLALSPAAARAQPAGAASASATRPPREAAQYDFLVGQWELTVTPKVSGLAARIHGVPKLRGSWKAWRALDGWGIEDELRILDASGNPRTFTHHVRVYDQSARRWTIATVDVYRQQLARATAHWQGGAMTTLGEGKDGQGKAYASRTRLSRITPTSFRYEQDRSYDGGRTWDEALLVIEARRVAATASR